MGTSQSSTGPTGRSPLVPSWADDQPQQPLPAPQPARLKPFRQSLGRFVSSGDRGELQAALGNYARKGTGGGGSASRRMGLITHSGGSLYGALTGTGDFGVSSDFRINLAQLVGKPCDFAIAKITQALTPNNGDADKIRVAMNHALVQALDGIDVFDISCITDDVIISTMINYVTESIFLQIVSDAGKAWNKATDKIQSLNAESDLRELIKVIVDKNMASKLAGNVRIFMQSEIVNIERQVIIDVWSEWETY